MSALATVSGSYLPSVGDGQSGQGNYTADHGGAATNDERLRCRIRTQM